MHTVEALSNNQQNICILLSHVILLFTLGEGILKLENRSNFRTKVRTYRRGEKLNATSATA